MPYPYAEARLPYLDGQLQAATGEPGPARMRLEAAPTIFRRLGARQDAERGGAGQRRSVSKQRRLPAGSGR